MGQDKITREKKTIEVMIRMYCRNKHLQRDICVHCRELLTYAEKRLDNCIPGTKRKTCGQCEIHCYKPEMREKIKTVMRFSGPRMILRHPILLVKHLLDRMG